MQPFGVLKKWVKEKLHMKEKQTRWFCPLKTMCWA